MNTFSYEAYPKVVKGKTKFKNEGTENIQLIGTNKNLDIKSLTKENNSEKKPKGQSPIQLETQAVEQERENKKIEMLKNQLIDFKKQKDKKTPYEIRPGPAPKIDVDLKYFITEQNVVNPATAQVDIQCDEFKAKPPTPKYQPKKTGIDITTQIGDYDLFDFDREVEPILHVIVDKTIEQASLEINEENEIIAIKQFKKEFERRKADENEEWERILKKEIMRLKTKNSLVKKKRDFASVVQKSIKIVECIHISKNYLKDCFRNSLKFFIDRDYWKNPTSEAISSLYIPHVIQKFIDKKSTKQQITDAFIDLTDYSIQGVSEQKNLVSKKRIEAINKRAERRILQHEYLRQIRLIFSNLSRPQLSEFTIKLAKYLKGNLADWIKENEENYRKIMDKIAEQEEGYEEAVLHYNESLVASSNELHLSIKGIECIGFHVSSDPVQSISENLKRYKIFVACYDSEGKLIGQCNDSQIKETNYMNFKNLEFDPKLEENSDYRIVLDLLNLPPQFDLALFYILDTKPSNAKEGWYVNSRYKFVDECLCQPINSYNFNLIREKSGKSENEESQQIKGYICGRIYKTEDDCMLEILNIPFDSNVNLEKMISEMGELNYNKVIKPIDLSKVLSELSAQMSTSKIGPGGKSLNKSKSNKKEDKKGKKDDKSKGSKISDKSKPSLSMSKDEEKKEAKEEPFENKMKKYKDHVLGPIEIDCRNSKEMIEHQITEFINQNDSELMNDCMNGIEIYVHNKPIRNGEHIKKWAKRMSNIVYRPKMPTIIPTEIAENLEHPENEEIPVEEDQ